LFAIFAVLMMILYNLRGLADRRHAGLQRSRQSMSLAVRRRATARLS
jgi:hypothetical protein